MGSSDRHQANWASFAVLDEAHPFLGPIFMRVDAMRCRCDLRAPRLEFVEARMEVVDAEIKNGFRACITFDKHQPRIAAGEEGHRSGIEQMPEPEHVAMPVSRGFNIAYRSCDLPDRAHFRVFHKPATVDIAAGRDAIPHAQLLPPRHSQFREDIGDVILRRIRAYALSSPDLDVGQSMADALGHTPFGGRQDIGMGRAAPCLSPVHSRGLAEIRRIFPTR